MAFFKNDLPSGFNTPTALPETSEQIRHWQEANRSWWENHPMRYDWKEKINFPEFTKEFYQEIDRRFFEDVKEYMPWEKKPFESLIDFEFLSTKNVLEIGIGNGSNAQLLAESAAKFTGIDITEYAVNSTLKRMQCFDINANIIRMDAEEMQFPDRTFDFIWSWGVIHHSSNTKKILQEMYRVLKPGGQAITMVYHRNFWNYYIIAGLFHGIFRGELFKTKSLHKIMQLQTDGAIARFYSIPEWQNLVSEFFTVENVLIFGGKSEIIPLPAGKIKQIIKNLIPNQFSRFFTNRCQMGCYLVSILKKPE